MQIDRIRNFSIIAHIDHGKSTLADRLLERTGTIGVREATAQFLDTHGARARKGRHHQGQGRTHGLSTTAPHGPATTSSTSSTPPATSTSPTRSRAPWSPAKAPCSSSTPPRACEAQTLANLYTALENDLTIIPVINKIDLPNAEPERVAEELARIVGFSLDEMIYASAKEGIGTDDVLEAIVERIPPPQGDPKAPLRALIFDSKYDSYKGVIAYVRVVDGAIEPRPNAAPHGRRTRRVEPIEIGVFAPDLRESDGPRLRRGRLRRHRPQEHPRVPRRRHHHAGRQARAPSRCPATARPSPWSSPASIPPRPPTTPSCATPSRSCSLSDASLTFEPESSVALGFGFRCGFLGLFHMEIVRERLEREYDLTLIFTAPSVEYRSRAPNGGEMVLDNPAELPPPNEIAEIREPWVDISIVLPDRFVGAAMELTSTRRGAYKRMEYLQTAAGEGGVGESRVLLEYHVPLSEILTDYYDQLKSRTQGYASLDYTFAGYEPARLVKLDILVNGQPVDALSIIVHPEEAQYQGPRAGREAAAPHPAPALRGADPGGHRRPHHRARDHPRHAQERPRQVLRRRRHAASASSWRSRPRARSACAASATSRSRRRPSWPSSAWSASREIAFCAASVTPSDRFPPSAPEAATVSLMAPHLEPAEKFLCHESPQQSEL